MVNQWAEVYIYKKNRRHFADDIFNCISVNENVWIPIKISLKFVPHGPINNIPALVQIMAWRRPGDKPLSGPMMVKLPTHICVTRPQWVNGQTDTKIWLCYQNNKLKWSDAIIFMKSCWQTMLVVVQVLKSLYTHSFNLNVALIPSLPHKYINPWHLSNPEFLIDAQWLNLCGY